VFEPTLLIGFNGSGDGSFSIGEYCEGSSTLGAWLVEYIHLVNDLRLMTRKTDIAMMDIIPTVQLINNRNNVDDDVLDATAKTSRSRQDE